MVTSAPFSGVKHLVIQTTRDLPNIDMARSCDVSSAVPSDTYASSRFITECRSDGSPVEAPFITPRSHDVLTHLTVRVPRRVSKIL